MAEVLDDAFNSLMVSCDGCVVMSPEELMQAQYGIPLKHYAQQYLFGATGLRLRTMNSIAGLPQSCKSPLLFDLIGHNCASVEDGGLGGLAYIYELEDKINPALLMSVLMHHGKSTFKNVRLAKNLTLETAFKHIVKVALPDYNKTHRKFNVPFIIGLDSIGGAATSDMVDKINAEGAVGKGFHEKAHYMKYFCENASALIGHIPLVIICINQEKERAAATPYGPPQKVVTGGVSQVFKDSHMISTTYKTLASGDGKLITMRTTKTSFSDQRKIEVYFRWNKYGQEGDDPYNLHFEWALASAKVIAEPDKGIGEIRDICDVKISDQNLVTCPTFGLKSVKPEEFEQALFAQENENVLRQLRIYQKIDVIKDLSAYQDQVDRELAKKPAAAKEAAAPKTTVAKKVKKTKEATKVVEKPKEAVSIYDLAQQAEEPQQETPNVEA